MQSNNHGKKPTPDHEVRPDRSPAPARPEGEEYNSSLREFHVDWHTFLSAQGAVFENGTVQHFTANSRALNCVTLCDLSQFSTLRISGPDAQSFLQNLLSNDIRAVSATQAQYSSFNTAKGRMFASFLIWRNKEDYVLQLPATLIEIVRKKLSLYVMRAKVTLANSSDEVISLGLSGVDAQKLLAADCAQLALLEVSNTENGNLIRLDDTRFQLNATPLQAQVLWKTLSAQSQVIGSAHWDWLNIRAGIPVILQKTQEAFVPQMVNFDLIGGINFKKGCYPGQEIVARMHYLGKLKRRMYLAHIHSDVSPLAGDILYSANKEATGMIANVAAAPKGGYDVLAVVQIASHDAHTIHLSQGEPLNFEALPYPFPSAS
ncbi:MAG: folate-binding protein [Gallionella sp.]